MPVPKQEQPPYVNLRRGRLSSRGYEVRTNYKTLRPRLEVRTREAMVFAGVEPGKTFTARGVSLLVPVWLPRCVNGRKALKRQQYERRSPRPAHLRPQDLAQSSALVGRRPSVGDGRVVDA